MVTPFRFRAVTSRPSGKWRSIRLTGGVVRSFLRVSGSPMVAGEVLSFQFSFCVSGAIVSSLPSFSVVADVLMGVQKVGLDWTGGLVLGWGGVV